MASAVLGGAVGSAMLMAMAPRFKSVGPWEFFRAAVEAKTEGEGGTF